MSEPETAVFISYAHIDNESAGEGSRGWVEEFAGRLSVCLNKRFGRHVEVWRDPELKRAQLFDQVIEERVRGAGVMLSLISEAYLNSDYCNQEIEWFRDQVGPRLKLGDYLRVFPVRLFNIPPARWPEACRGAAAFTFFEAEGPRDFGRPLDPDSEAFEDELWNLADELYEVLTRLGSPEAAESTPGERAFRVFLAHPSDDLKPTWRRLAEELAREEGIAVLRRIPPPDEIAEHAEAVQEAVREADLTVHLISAQAGEPMDEHDAERTFPREQLELSLEHARSQLVLMPEGFDVTRIAQASWGELLASLPDRNLGLDRLEQVRVDRLGMLDEIRAKRRRLEEAARQREEAARSAQDESGFSVFLAHPPDDLKPTYRRLARELAREGIAVLDKVPPPDEDPEHRQAVEQAVGRARLSVHLLSDHPGEPMDESNEERTFPREQLELGLDHARSQLVLMPEGLDFELVKSDSYRAFLEQLTETKRASERLELVEVGRPQMLDQILATRQRLEEIEQRKEAETAAGSAPGTAFIDLQTSDARHAADLVGYLFQQQFVPIMAPAMEKSPSAGMDEFEKNLKQARLFIVVFGAAERKWVDYRLQEAVKIIFSEGLNTRVVVYVAPPRKEASEVEFPRLAEVALNMERFDPTTIEPLLEKLAQSRS